MMRIMFRTVLVASLLLSAAACSQNAAHIEMRGDYVYGRDGVTKPSRSERKYLYAKLNKRATSKRSTYKKPVAASNNATIQKVAVNDLPPAKTREKVKPRKLARNYDSEPKVVNLWTKKKRSNKQVSTIRSAKKAPAKRRSYRSAKTYMWPVSSRRVISNFGPKGAGKANDGINIASARGEPVWASADGEVIYVGNKLKGYGNMVLIKHSKNKSTTYAHLSRSTVDKYDRVKQGDIIGYVGSTGKIKSPQLHFAVREGKEAVNPKNYLSTNVAGL